MGLEPLARRMETELVKSVKKGKYCIDIMLMCALEIHRADHIAKIQRK